MGKFGVSIFLTFLVILSLSFIISVRADVAAPTVNSITGVGDSDVQKIQGAVNNIPIADNGSFDPSKLKPVQSKAELRIAAINTYVGPITKFLFGVELTLSWIFIFAIVLWIEIIELIGIPLKSLFNMNSWMALLGGFCVSTIIMHGFGNRISQFLVVTLNVWWMALIALFLSIPIFFVVYPMIFKKINKMREDSAREQERIDRGDIHRFADSTNRAAEELSKK